MFYSHVYLKRNGRFGLIWLAATQSRVLTKRELHVINISNICSDILEHITGNSGKDTYKRPKRFSLYLSSQLMYGAVVVFSKQWESLLGDATALLRRVHPDHPTTAEIDLVVSSKHDLATLDSCVPLSIKDKYYDPYFGLNKESTVDVDKFLESWDQSIMKDFDIRMLDLPQFVKPVLGSPHSVSDPLEIQIREKVFPELSPMLPGEKDLPALDYENLQLLQHSSEEIFASSDDSKAASTRISPLLGRHSNEVTPLAKVAGTLPGTPQKKRKRPHSPDKRKKPAEDVLRPTGDVDVSLSLQEDLLQTSKDKVGDEQLLDKTIAEMIQTMSPLGRLSHDWLQTEPALVQLTPIISVRSPARKRKPSKLIVDETFQLKKSEMKENMLTSADTTIPLVCSEPPEKDFLNSSGSKIFDNAMVLPLWRKGCKFGILAYDTETDSSSFTSPLPPTLKRKRSPTEEEDLPEFKRKGSAATRLTTSSIEQQREASAISAIGEDRSHSVLALSGDESGLSAIQSKSAPHLEPAFSSIADQGMPSLIEEQEAMFSPPGPLPPDETLVEAVRKTSVSSSPLKDFINCFLRCQEQTEGPITFKELYPPQSTTRVIASKMFMALCTSACLGKVQVVQEYPYGDIFIYGVESQL